jgi:hypothetical protein
MVQALGGEEMAYKIAGGTKWWQVRAGKGVEGEWIVMKKDWREYSRKKGVQVDKEKEKEKEKERMGAEGMVGEDGGVGENGECGSLRHMVS